MAQGQTQAAQETQWWRHYQKIGDPKAHEFMRAARALLQSQYGHDALPIRVLRLRLSQPVDANAGFTRGFRLTSVDQRASGDVTLYVSHGSPRNTLYGQIAHEVFHSHDPDLRGYFTEGLAGLFARDVFRQLGIRWELWEAYFQRRQAHLYGNSYLLMSELSNLLGAPTVRAMARHTASSDGGQSRYIDVSAWLSTLTDAQCAVVKQRIEQYHQQLQDTALASHSAPRCAP